MKRHISLHLLLISAALLVAAPLFAQHEQMKSEHMKSMSATPSFQSDWWAEIAISQTKLDGLAKAIPADKYNWRPSPVVRTVSEVFAHVAQTNYMFAKMLGVSAPADVPKDAEKTVTKKADVIALLNGSFDQLKKIDTSKMNLNDKVKVFGHEMSKRRVLLMLQSHCHEHLGQMIAYARSIGVVPPWSK